MGALEPLYTALLPLGGGGSLFLAFRFLQWIRTNKVEDAKTATERLDSENQRLEEKLLAAEAEAEGWKKRQESTRQILHAEQDYSSSLRRLLIANNITPPPERREEPSA